MAIRIGNGSNNNLNGTIFSDAMFGMGGDDVLYGGFGADVLTGGSGRDVFLYKNVLDSVWFAPDIITDFQQCTDKIDLSCFLGSTDLAFDYDHDPIANGVWTTKVSIFGIKTTIVKVDVTGDAKADMHIVLNGWHNLNKNDFVGVNNGPTAVDDTAGPVCENDSGICIDVLANDTDPDGCYDSLCLSDLADCASMTVAGDGNEINAALLAAITPEQLADLFCIEDEKIHFKPGNTFDALLPGQTATITIEYTIKDESGAEDTATLTVEVTGKADTAADRWIVSDFAAGFSVGDWAALANDNDTTLQTIDSVNESILFFDYDGDFDFFTGYSLANGSTAFEYTTSLGETQTVSVDKLGTNLLNNDLVDISAEDYDFAHLDGLGGNDTLIGGAARDQLVGGLGDDVLRGGGSDDTMTGGGDIDLLTPPNDIFQLVTPTANGTDVITDFDAHGVVPIIGTNFARDRIAFQQGEGGWNASGTTPGSGSTSTLVSGAYQQSLSAIANITAGDTNKVIELQSAVADAAAVGSATGGVANAYVVLFNTGTGRGEIWWDGDWSNTDDRYQVATIDNIDSLGELTYLNRFDFAEWQV